MSWSKYLGARYTSVARERASVPYNAGVTRPTDGELPGFMRADQIRDGDPIELSNGRLIHCMSAGRRHAGAHIEGAKVLATDPAVEDNAGIDAGVVWNDGKNLRAPDIVVGGYLERLPGWMDQAPPLAVEYSDTGQNEEELQEKIVQLLELGVRLIWVVRLTGELQVEVYRPDRAMEVVGRDGVLEAPGILKNPVPVRALVDPAESNRVALRNLLQRLGHDSVEQLQRDSEVRGKRDGNLDGLRTALDTVLMARGFALDPETRARLGACADSEVLNRWISRAATATTLDVVFADDGS